MPVGAERVPDVSNRPFPAAMTATCPWYGGASPMYPPVVATTRPLSKLSEEAIFSREGSFVIERRQTACPVETESFWIRPSGEAA